MRNIYQLWMHKRIMGGLRRFLVHLVLVLGCTRTIGAQITLTSVNPASGPASGGTAITISGTELSDSACFPLCNQRRLLIGGVDVSFSVPDPGTILAVTPPHAAGTVDIVYFPPDYPDGFEGYVLPNAFTYVSSAATTNVPAYSQRQLMLLTLALALAGMAILRRG